MAGRSTGFVLHAQDTQIALEAEVHLPMVIVMMTGRERPSSLREKHGEGEGKRPDILSGSPQTCLRFASPARVILTTESERERLFSRTRVIESVLTRLERDR